MKYAIIFDTETTGLALPPSVELEKQPHIIEFGAAKVYEDGSVSELNGLYNPGFKVSEEITKITGITNEQLADQPALSSDIQFIYDLMSGASMVVAHNLEFDKAMIDIEMKRHKLHPLP
jgi:DNA polymerase-3 subunit epsilon